MIDQVQPIDPKKAAKYAYSRAYSVGYRARKREYFKAYSKRYHQENKEQISAKEKSKYANLTAEEMRAKREVDRLWRLRHPERSKELSRNSYYRNKGKNVPWAKRNPEKRRLVARQYARRLRETPKGALDHRMSAGVRRALKLGKGGKSWETLVGYTVDDLHRHIESNFKPGMNWDRLLRGQIHIDHVIPKSKFNYSSPEDLQFRQCWALDNLQPKWARPNLAKSARLEKHEQISLGLI